MRGIDSFIGNSPPEQKKLFNIIIFCGVVTLSVCLVPLELVMYTKHACLMHESNKEKF